MQKESLYHAMRSALGLMNEHTLFDRTLLTGTVYVSLKSSNPDEKQGLISTFLTPEKDEQQEADELVA